MAKTIKEKPKKIVDTLLHREASRRNIPTAEYQSVMRAEELSPIRVTDEGDLEDVYNTERHLLYVACTRARDNLLVTSTAPKSEFLDDLV